MDSMLKLFNMLHFPESLAFICA